MMTTPEAIYERYSVRISQEQLDAFRELQRRAEGLPFHDDRISASGAH
jgi:hypothetical protein